MKSQLLTLILLFTMPALSTLAQKGEQEGPVGIFQSGAEYDSFMRGVKTAAYGEGGSAELRAMIPMLNDMVLGQEFGTTANQYDTNTSEFDLLANPKVREDINMVDEQYEELQKLNADIRSRMADRIRALDFSDRDRLADRLKAIRADANKELESLFIPDQLARLEQIRNRSLLRRRSFVDLLTSDPLKSRLEITSRQADQLRDSEAEIQKELQEEIAKLQEKARKRLLDNLNQDQQEQVEEIFGELFVFENRRSKNRDAKKGGAKKGK